MSHFLFCHCFRHMVHPKVPETLKIYINPSITREGKNEGPQLFLITLTRIRYGDQKQNPQASCPSWAPPKGRVVGDMRRDPLFQEAIFEKRNIPDCLDLSVKQEEVRFNHGMRMALARNIYPVVMLCACSVLSANSREVQFHPVEYSRKVVLTSAQLVSGVF